MNYTDGKWVVANWHSGRVVARQPDGSQVTVATAHGPQNAALIAAAPDMLAALFGFIEWGEQFENDSMDAWTREKLGSARAAIAKAKGQA